MKRIPGILALLFSLLMTSCPISAQDAGDIFIKMHSESEIDAGKLVQDLVDRTVSELKTIANPAELKKIGQVQDLLEEIGLHSLDKYYLRYDLLEDKAEVNVRLSFKEKEKFLPALLTLPDKDLQIPAYLDPTEYMFFLDIASPVESIRKFSGFLESPSVKNLLAPNDFSLSDALSLFNIDLEKDIFPALGDEISFALVPPAEKSSRPDFVFAARITAKENLNNLISRFAPSAKPQNLGEFDLYESSANFSFAAGNQFLVASNNSGRLKKIIGGWKAGKEAVKAGLYLYMDMQKINSTALPLLQDKAGMKSDEAGLLEPFQSKVSGAITVTRNVDDNTLVISASSPRSLISSFYRTCVSIVPLMAKKALLEEREQKVEKEARSNAYAVIQALNSYYDSQNAFPSKADVLFKKGLLGVLVNPYTEKPVLFVAPGKRSPGNFSYIPIRNKKGIVGGFYLIGYGPADKPGKDIYGPKDFKDLKNFKPVPDGIPDGIIIMEKILK